MIFQSTVTDRALYDQARESLIKAGVSATAYDNAVNTQSFLRLVQPLVAGQNQFTFPVLNNQTGTGVAQRLDEVRLSQQDAFFVAKVYMWIFKSAGYNPVPCTYPNAITFATGSAKLYTLYNAKMQITINNSVVVPAYPTSNFLNIPQTQLTGATNTPQDQFDGTSMLPWAPSISFIGTNQTDLVITMPTSMTALDANTYCAITLQGIRSQNVALGAVTS